jgi:hypothetical protein
MKDLLDNLPLSFAGIAISIILAILWLTTDLKLTRYLYGSAPKDRRSCPENYPIRADEYERYYYLKNERIRLEVDWCFEDEKTARKEGFIHAPEKYRKMR